VESVRRDGGRYDGTWTIHPSELYPVVTSSYPSDTCRASAKEFRSGGTANQKKHKCRPEC
jgi:hypothetical protein